VVKPRRFIGLLSISLVAVMGGCQVEPAQKPTTTLTIAAGSADGVYYSVGKALAAAYNRLPGVQARAELGEMSSQNVEKIETGAADLSFDGAGHAYLAFKHGTQVDRRPHERLRAIAVLFSTAVHIAARRGSGIRGVEDFRGKRIAVGSRGSSTEEASLLVLESYGLNYDSFMPVFPLNRDLATDAREGILDGFFQFTPLQHAVMTEVIGSLDFQLIPITREKIADIQERSPFLLKSTRISAGTYRGQTEDVMTVGTDILLLCREDLPDQLVHDLTRTLFAAAPELAAAHPAAAGIDPDRGPAASIPLHPGAARYYRERELLR